MLWPTYAAPQITSAKNTSEGTSVPTISRCFQRFLLVPRTNRSCSVGASVTDDLCSASLLFNTTSHTSLPKTPGICYRFVWLARIPRSPISACCYRRQESAEERLEKGRCKVYTKQHEVCPTAVIKTVEPLRGSRSARRSSQNPSLGLCFGVSWFGPLVSPLDSALQN